MLANNAELCTCVTCISLLSMITGYQQNKFETFGKSIKDKNATFCLIEKKNDANYSGLIHETGDATMLKWHIWIFMQMQVY